MRLRPFLGLLTAGAIAPLALFGLLVAAVMIGQAGGTFRDTVQKRGVATGTAIDATIDGTIATLQALGAAIEVDAADYNAFRLVAARILKTQPHWSNINLALPDGQQVVNLQLPQGAKLHSFAGIDGSVQAIHFTRGPVVNDIAFGTATQAWDIAVRVPIIRDNEIRFILTGVVKPEAIAEALLSQELAPGWRAHVVDGRERIIAAIEGGRVIGEPGRQAPAFLHRVIEAGGTAFDNPDGEHRYTTVHRSAVTGWTLVMDVPASGATEAAWQAAWLLVAGLIVALAAAFFLSWIVGRRRLLHPIESMAAATAAVGRGEAADVPDVRSVTEINALSSALKTAVGAMREREHLIRRERDALQSADRAKTEFIAMLSHELRNPLAALTAAAHLLKLGGASARTLGQVQPVIERQTAQMSRLVEDLLDISRITMGKASLELEVFDLGRAAANLFGTWRATGRLDRHTVRTGIAEVWVQADRARMEQVLSNLLDNALKFTPEGRKVTLRVGQRGDQALIEIADEGAGLSEEARANLFSLFMQDERSLHRTRGGLGIGLALVKRIVEMHDGTVEAHSEGRGKGSCFRVRLPAVARPDAASRPRRQWREPGRKLRVLLVEDNDDTRRMLAKTLELAGHDVRQAANGASALAIAREVQPDAMLLDIGLPDIDGYELARQLRAQGPNRESLLIALTGYGLKEDRERAASAGFDVHLTKPVEPEVLARALGAR